MILFSAKTILKTWFRFCGTMFSLVVSKSSHRVCRLQAAKPTGCFYMPYAHDMREKPVRREIVEFIRPADNRPLLRKPWLFRRIALQQRGPMLLFACKGAYGPRRLWARSSTSGSMKKSLADAQLLRHVHLHAEGLHIVKEDKPGAAVRAIGKVTGAERTAEVGGPAFRQGMQPGRASGRWPLLRRERG